MWNIVRLKLTSFRTNAKIKLRFLLILVLIMVLLTTPLPLAIPRIAIKCVGHRGNQAQFPENVLVGLKSAFQVSDGVETFARLFN
jgi:glycerophosphoryl diester phosphodiesterase